MSIWIMPTDRWEGFPEVGTRVRVPYGATAFKEGEIIGFLRFQGRPMAEVGVWRTSELEPDLVEIVKVPYALDEMEVIAPASPGRESLSC
jgi:hypothetical protein